MVLPLSTNQPQNGLLSNFQCCVFIKRSRLCCHIMLLTHWLPVYLASSSVPLRTYVFSSSEQLRLATFVAPHCLTTAVLSTFHMIPKRTLRFCYLIVFETIPYIIKRKVMLNYPGSATSAASFPFGKQNTALPLHNTLLGVNALQTTRILRPQPFFVHSSPWL